jgi:hypothetical protein
MMKPITIGTMPLNDEVELSIFQDGQFNRYIFENINIMLDFLKFDNKEKRENDKVKPRCRVY